MNTKNLFRTLTVAAFAALTLSACNNAGKMDEKPAAAQTAAPSSLKIAFIEVDSIMTQYNFCKDYSKILEKRGNNIQSALASQEKNLEAAIKNYQGLVDTTKADKVKEIEEAYQRYLDEQTSKRNKADEAAAARGEHAGRQMRVGATEE